MRSVETKIMKHEIADGIYNRQIGLPLELAQPFLGRWRLVLSKHCKAAMQTDRHGAIVLDNFLTVIDGRIVEITVTGGVAEKVLHRAPYSPRLDLTIVLVGPRPDAGTIWVKTCWLNVASDNHSTLRRSAYNAIPVSATANSSN